jgi:hypothetical protein
MSARKLISSLTAGAPLPGFAGGVLSGVVDGGVGDGGVVDGGVAGDVVEGVFAGVFGEVVDGVFAGVLGDVVDGVFDGGGFDDDGLVGASSIEPLQPSASMLAASQAKPNVARSAIGKGSAIGEEAGQDCRLKGTSRRAMAEVGERPQRVCAGSAALFAPQPLQTAGDVCGQRASLVQ